MIDKLYRIRQKSTGLWYGRKQRFGKTPWRKKPEKYIAKAALLQILKGSLTQQLDDIEIVVYHISELERFSPDFILNGKK